MDTTLRHHGIKGQKWGVRRFQNKDGTLKMYYGKGAGTRRKLIKASVEQKMKDANYKEAFNKAVAEQDMAKRASEARTKRKVEDTKSSTAKTVRGLINAANGNAGRASAASIAIFSAVHMTGLDKKLINKGKSYVDNLFRKKVVRL